MPETKASSRRCCHGAFSTVPASALSAGSCRERCSAVKRADSGRREAFKHVVVLPSARAVLGGGASRYVARYGTLLRLTDASVELCDERCKVNWTADDGMAGCRRRGPLPLTRFAFGFLQVHKQTCIGINPKGGRGGGELTHFKFPSRWFVGDLCGAAHFWRQHGHGNTGSTPVLICVAQAPRHAAAVAISMANFDVGTHRGCGCKGGAAATSRAANLCRGAYCLGTCACAAAPLDPAARGGAPPALTRGPVLLPSGQPLCRRGGHRSRHHTLRPSPCRHEPLFRQGGWTRRPTKDVRL